MRRPTVEGVARRLAELGMNWQGSGSVNVEKVVRYGTIVGSVIECHQTLGRAMERARSRISGCAVQNEAFPSGTVILADTMLGSKGRFTRSWHAPKGGLWGCMVHGNNLLPQSRQFIPMAVGVACCETIRDLGVHGALLRWVNDILIEGVKVAGFLVEGYTEPTHSEEFTLVGFGINVNNCSFPAELDGLAMSLKQHLKQEVDLTDFTEYFLARLGWNFGILYHEEEKELAGENFTGPGGRHLLLSQWISLSDTIGKNVVYGFDVMTNPQYRAKVIGVDPSGGLVLQFEDGHTKVEFSGEVRYHC